MHKPPDKTKSYKRKFNKIKLNKAKFNKAKFNKAMIRYKAKNYFIVLIKYILLIELSFTIIYPLFTQLMSSFMSETDLVDKTVQYFSKNPTIDNYVYLIKYVKYWSKLFNSVLLSVGIALVTVLVASVVGYGLAKFKFKGKILIFAIVLISIIVPPQTVMLSLFVRFRYFDFFGIMSKIGNGSINLTGTLWPIFLLSGTGFGYRGGIFIILMRQYYLGTPKELIESAYIDGAGVYKTYSKIIFPLGKSVMTTVFLLSFSWMWTDTFYANILYPDFSIVSRIISESRFIGALGVQVGTLLSGMYINTASILVLLPLLIVFIFGQRFMVEGIERSGITG